MPLPSRPISINRTDGRVGPGGLSEAPRAGGDPGGLRRTQHGGCSAACTRRTWATTTFATTTIGLSDFRKLITVDTPHGGSPLANILDDIETSYPLCRRLTERLANHLHWCLTCGAVRDLRTDSPKIATLPPVSVPTTRSQASGLDDRQRRADWSRQRFRCPRALSPCCSRPSDCAGSARIRCSEMTSTT